jgi:hypothetical protein
MILGPKSPGSPKGAAVRRKCGPYGQVKRLSFSNFKPTVFENLLLR